MAEGYDPRAVANFMLDLAAERDALVSNLVLQKLLYFAHGHYLIRHKNPLVQGAFEAWTHGPVHSAVYQTFKHHGGAPITSRAVGRNVITGEPRILARPESPAVEVILRDVLKAYGHLSPTRLIDISHASKGPWDAVMNKTQTSVSLGARIPDSVIRESFRHHKISIGDETRAGEPDEDTPLVGN